MFNIIRCYQDRICVRTKGILVQSPLERIPQRMFTSKKKKNVNYNFGGFRPQYFFFIKIFFSHSFGIRSFNVFFFFFFGS